MWERERERDFFIFIGEQVNGETTEEMEVNKTDQWFEFNQEWIIIEYRIIDRLISW